jgi:hypothetical protein
MERVVAKIFPCANCKKEFTSRGSLHKHLKQHGLNLASYYTKYHPRLNQLTGDPLPFKRFEEYFERDFSTKQQLLKWCKESPASEVKEYAMSLLQKRHWRKGRKYGPFHLETKNSFMPSVSIYKELFGSYNAACEAIGCEPLYNKNLPKGFFNFELPKDLDIAIDTREQQPLSFTECSNQALKLDIGDYTALGKHYSYTFVDRKSGNDLQGTLAKNNIERFRREIVRAQEMDAYLFVVIESSVEKIRKENSIFNRRSNIDYTLRQIKDICHDYPRVCQFIFVGTRDNATSLIPRLLITGKSVWQTDMQYFWDTREE